MRVVVMGLMVSVPICVAQDSGRSPSLAGNNFVNGNEGNNLNSKVPDANNSQSGPTVGGIDLGQQSSQGIKDLHLPVVLRDSSGRSLEDRLVNYINALDSAGSRSGAAAKAYNDSHPFQLANTTELSALRSAILSRENGDLARAYDAVSAVKFRDLPSDIQTAISDVAHQYGTDLSKRTPKFWDAVTHQRWYDAHTELQHFGDRYQTRRNKDAKMMENSVSGPWPSGSKPGLASPNNNSPVNNSTIRINENAPKDLSSVNPNANVAGNAAKSKWLAQVEGGNPYSALSNGTYTTLGQFNSLDEARAAEKQWDDAHPGNLRFTREVEVPSSGQPASNTNSKSDTGSQSMIAGQSSRTTPSGSASGSNATGLTVTKLTNSTAIGNSTSAFGLGSNSSPANEAVARGVMASNRQLSPAAPLSAAVILRQSSGLQHPIGTTSTSRPAIGFSQNLQSRVSQTNGNQIGLSASSSSAWQARINAMKSGSPGSAQSPQSFLGRHGTPTVQQSSVQSHAPVAIARTSVIPQGGSRTQSSHASVAPVRPANMPSRPTVSIPRPASQAPIHRPAPVSRPMPVSRPGPVYHNTSTYHAPTPLRGFHR